MRIQATTARVPAAARSLGYAVRWLGAALLLLFVLAALVGLAFSGSKERLASGIVVDGVDVGGMSHTEAQRTLEKHVEAVAQIPVVFTAEERRFSIKAATVGVEADWEAAIATAADESGGFGPVRGYRRLRARLFGVEIAPPVQAYSAALQYKLSRLGDEIDRHHVEAKLVRRGLSVVLVPEQSGISLDRKAAADTIVAALSRLDRGSAVELPLTVEPAEVTTADLSAAARQARLALSAPVRLEYGKTRWKLPRWRIAQLLSLPDNGSTQLAIAGPAADAWFAKLRATVERPAVNATFGVSGDRVWVIAAKSGNTIDIPATSRALVAAATTPGARIAPLAVELAQPDRTTAEARAMGIERRLASYTTANAGSYDRITNLHRAIELLDGALVAPGAVFSLNETVGERTLERGFRPAPVIIGNEYEEDVGGGVSQIATTAFNAGWEAGLKIAERNPHSLYISRYQLGRDATVNYPNLDLKFVNDTPKWILVSGSWDAYGVTIALYGGGPARRVVSGAGEIRETRPAPVKETPDPTLEQGKTVTDAVGSPARATSVTRTVYKEDGSILYDETWNTNYNGEAREIRVGTKPKPKEPNPDPKTKPGPKVKEDPAVPPLELAVPLLDSRSPATPRP